MSAPVFLVSSVVLHWVLCRLISPWWIPDISLVALILVVGASPERWLVPSLLIGIVTMCWAVQTPLLPLWWYPAVGGSLRIMARMWDVDDLRIQLIVVALAESMWLLLHFWVQEIHALPLFLFATMHVAITVMMVPVMHRTARRWGLA